MVRKNGRQSKREGGTRSQLDDDIDALFGLPLAEFIGARKALAAQLKKEGRSIDVERVNALAKPSISAWTVNQLYWNHREEFDRLISTGQRFHKAQSSRVAGKASDMREALDARRDALSELSDLATSILHDAGHNPSLDTIRRITSTLEALSAYALLPDGPTAGRLTQDVDPPSFESLASLMPQGGAVKHSAVTQTRQKATPAEEARSLKESRQARIAAAKSSLQAAKKSVADARARAQSLETEQKKVDAVAKEAEKQKREAEARFKKARFVAEDAMRRARSSREEVDEARKALEDARRNVEKATKELESLFRE
jgi:hypothetical protein